jgi:hypothetical protein
MGVGRHVLCCCAVALLVTGCGSRKEPSEERVAAPAAIVMRDAGIRFMPPLKWSRERLSVRPLHADSAAAMELSGAAHGVAFDYKAEQPGHRNQPLLRILVFDRNRWASLAAEGGPPVGEAIDSVGGWIYVAALPQSNPYRDETLDADQFDDMHLSLDDVRAAFAVEGNGPSLAKR